MAFNLKSEAKRFCGRCDGSRRGLLWLLAGSFFFFGPWACGRQAKPRNFLLITLDTQRADYISAYNPGNASTPHIDLLAREGLLFRNAYSLIPITLPSHASLFFSEEPHRIKNYNNGQEIGEKRSRPSFVNLFRQKGFATAAFVSLGVLGSEYGLDQGFEVYEDSFPEDRWYLSADEVNARVFPWLEDNKNRPFFLWVHYSDPHDPYAPPYVPLDLKIYLNDRLIAEKCIQRYALNEVTLDLRPGKNELRMEFRNEFDSHPDHFHGRFDLLEFEPTPDGKALMTDFIGGFFIRGSDHVFFIKHKSLILLQNNAGPRPVKLRLRGKPLLTRESARTAYQREVEFMDAEVGKLWEKLKELGLFDDTAILIVGDHGEGLGEFHNIFGDPHFGHIHYLYDMYLRVPLLIRSPSIREKGVVREEYVSLLDVAPTVANLMGLKPLPHFRGKDLARTQRAGRTTIFEETYRPEAFEDKFGLLSFPWHLVLTPQKNRYELYDLDADPEEKDNLVKEAAWPTAVLPLKQNLEEFAREVLRGKEAVQIDDKTKEMLRALGYIR
ncbi:MAG: sulfatase [Acidobacteriota bacterium]